MNTNYTNSEMNSNFTPSLAYLAYKVLVCYNGMIFSPVQKSVWTYGYGYYFLKSDKKPEFNNTSGIYAASIFEASNYKNSGLDYIMALVSPSSPNTEDCVVIGDEGWRANGASVIAVLSTHSTLKNNRIKYLTTKECLNLLLSLEDQGYPQIEYILQTTRSSVLHEDYKNLVMNEN